MNLKTYHFMFNLLILFYFILIFNNLINFDKISIVNPVFILFFIYINFSTLFIYYYINNNNYIIY